MIEIKYTCDRCEHFQFNNNQMWDITIALGQNRVDPVQPLKKLWCRDCMETMNLLPRYDPEKNKHIPVDTTKSPSLEDYIREIVREEITQ